MAKVKQETLTDALALVLLDLAGGPVPLKLLIQKLAQRGLEVDKTTVVQSLKRNPFRFYRESRGFYGLKLNGDGK